MTRIKKLCALVLAVMMVVTAGVISVNAAQSSDSDAVSADTTETGITIHVRMSDGTHPYVYLWNSLPTNSAMSKSYPGEKMTKGDKWYNYHVADVTKVNAIVTDSHLADDIKHHHTHDSHSKEDIEHILLAQP